MRPSGSSFQATFCHCVRTRDTVFMRSAPSFQGKASDTAASHTPVATARGGGDCGGRGGGGGGFCWTVKYQGTRSVPLMRYLILSHNTCGARPLTWYVALAKNRG